MQATVQARERELPLLRSRFPVVFRVRWLAGDLREASDPPRWWRVQLYVVEGVRRWAESQLRIDPSGFIRFQSREISVGGPRGTPLCGSSDLDWADKDERLAQQLAILDDYEL